LINDSWLMIRWGLYYPVKNPCSMGQKITIHELGFLFSNQAVQCPY
jgi:hypothetical protein